MSSAGQAIGGVLGGIAGFLIGGPTGLKYGAQIGLMLGGLLDKPKGPVVEGPRLEDLTVQTSTYGSVIPRVPRIVTIGGGHGLATLLRGLKIFTRNFTAVVTVADDGGSSGRLREGFGILPPGDIRNCLAALSNDERMLTQLFQYRFSSTGELEGHSFGNLFITALADITGSFEGAVAESGKVLSVNGRVLPATLHDVKLVADMQLPNSLNQVRVEGESRIPKMAGRVHRIWLEPNDAPAYPPVIKAILNAEMIVGGSGQFIYESVAESAGARPAWRDSCQPGG